MPTGGESSRSPRHSKESVPGSSREVKMDNTRAQGLLGFTSSRWLDGGLEPKEVLDKALFEQMQKSVLKKKHQVKEKKASEKRKTSGAKEEPPKAATVERKRGTPRQEKSKSSIDEAVMLHEAYQFLVKKYVSSRVAKKAETETDNQIPEGKPDVTPKKGHEEEEDDSDSDDYF